MEYSDKLKLAKSKLAIPYSSSIRGNIYLPDKIDDVSIYWTSSKPEVISDKDEGLKKKGVVTRGDCDTVVTLTAEMKYCEQTEKCNFEVVVKKAPEKLKAEDFEGYLFAHFIGEENEMGEQIYFALSDDGLNFKDLNNQKPIIISNVGEKGVRDPYLLRSAEGDRFFLIATDLSIYNRGGWVKNEQGYYDASTTGSPFLVLYESDDLVNWSEPRLINVAPANAGMAWAPEMVYNEETGEYVIFFSSSIMNPTTKYKEKPNAIYYVTTRDFVHYSETALLIDNQVDNIGDGKPREIIDTTILKIGEWYYSASKDGDNAEKNGGIRILKNRNLTDKDGWIKVLDLDELDLDISETDIPALDNSQLEGPELFIYNHKDWKDKNVPEYGLMADRYQAGSGYLPLVTTDFEDVRNEKKSWKLLTKDDYSFDVLKKRHGTILNITKGEVSRLKRF